MPTDDEHATWGRWLGDAETVVGKWEGENLGRLLTQAESAELKRRIAQALDQAFDQGRLRKQR